MFNLLKSNRVGSTERTPLLCLPSQDSRGIACADGLVWWGKEVGGPFCRIVLDGQGEGEWRYRPELGYDNRRNARLAARAAQGDVSRRSSVGGDGDGGRALAAAERSLVVEDTMAAVEGLLACPRRRCCSQSMRRGWRRMRGSKTVAGRSQEMNLRPELEEATWAT